ncbi:Calmodulin-like protein 3 [Platanthera guangdongensis]|uniref:Calmodulin-like protein 3 n=1 Tax=Platanthera guangdongensis TaxID=2320717 RepID=A0ABR2MJI4_9ASPA
MEAAELNRVFQMFNRNGDCRIPKKEHGNPLHNLDIHIPKAKLQSMMYKIDVNGDDCINMYKFGALHQTMMEERGEGGEEKDITAKMTIYLQKKYNFLLIRFELIKQVLLI